MEIFCPKNHIDHQYTSATCSHWVITENGFDDGMYGTHLHCLICDTDLYFPPESSFFIKQDGKPLRYHRYLFGALSRYDELVLNQMIQLLVKRYQNEIGIPLVQILTELTPEIDTIIRSLEKSPAEEKKSLRKTLPKNSKKNKK